MMIAIKYIVSALILLSTAPAALVGAQQSVTGEVYYACNTAHFNSNDTFADNWKAVGQSLTHNSSKTLYSTALSLSGSSSSYVYGMYQCRGDVSLSDCYSCVSNFVATVQTTTSTGGTCGSARGARIQYNGCYARYENYAFYSAFQDAAISPFPICSTSNDSSPVYQHNLATALNNTARAAPKHALFGYHASSVGTGSTTAYALSQCLGYLSPSQCATCLSTVSNYSGQCNNSVSGAVYFDGCYYQYANASFLFTSTSTVNPPANSPQRSPIASPTQASSPLAPSPVAPSPSTTAPTPIASTTPSPTTTAPAGSVPSTPTGSTIPRSPSSAPLIISPNAALAASLLLASIFLS